jgi:hypothetical protein
MTTNYYTQLNNLVIQQNNTLENNITNIKQLYSTDNKKFLYNEKEIYTLKIINFYLFILYFLLFFILLLAVYYGNNFNKMYIYLCIMIIFPFFISIIIYNYNIAMHYFPIFRFKNRPSILA